jgi:hypothetical protein
VGNSGRLRNEHHAERIEACDMVFRFNQGRTQVRTGALLSSGF